MQYEKEINLHLGKIQRLENQVNIVKSNYEKTKNLFLSEQINKKILAHEVEEMVNEIVLHNFCIECLRENKFVDLVIEYKFTSARKKKLNKVVQKYLQAQ